MNTESQIGREASNPKPELGKRGSTGRRWTGRKGKTKPSEAKRLKLLAVRNLSQNQEKRSHLDEPVLNQSVMAILDPF